MINHYTDLTHDEKILLCEIINQQKRCDIEADPEIAGCFKQEFVVEAINRSISGSLKGGEGAVMAESILKTITS